MIKSKHTDYALQNKKEITEVAYVVANDLTAVGEKVHQLGHAHGADQNALLQVLAAVGQQDGQQLDRRPPHMEVVLLQSHIGG